MRSKTMQCDLLDARRRSFARLLLVFVCAVCAAVLAGRTQGDEPPAGDSLAPSVCTIELNLPEGARVVADGHDRGTTRLLTFEKLAPGKEYRSILRITLERGALAQRSVSVRGGTVVRLALADFLNPADGKSTWGHPMASTRAATAAISPDGEYVASINEARVNLHRVKTGERVRQFTEHTAKARGLAFSPDGRFLATCAEDNTVLVWDVSSGERVQRIVPPEHPKFATTDAPRYRLRPRANIAEGVGAGIGTAIDQMFEPLRTRYSHVHSVVFSPDGRHLLSAQFDGSVRLWDAASGSQLRQFSGPTAQYSNEWIPAINMAAFSTDGRRVAAAEQQGQVRVWDTETGRMLLRIRADEHGALSAQFSPDDKYLLTVGADHVARIWDSASGKHLQLLYPGEAGAIRAACFATNGEVLTLGTDSTVRAWDPATGNELKSVALEPRVATRTLLVASLSDDTFLTDGWLGFQIRSAQTGRMERLLR